MLIVQSNGGLATGDEDKGLDHLLDLLARQPLSPVFEEFGNFVVPARRATCSWDAAAMCDVYEDAGPIHPEAPDAVRFSGNFDNYSGAFSVDTDEPEVIAKLTAAIRANQASEAYQAALAKLRARAAARKARTP